MENIAFFNSDFFVHEIRCGEPRGFFMHEFVDQFTIFFCFIIWMNYAVGAFLGLVVCLSETTANLEQGALGSLSFYALARECIHLIHSALCTSILHFPYKSVKASGIVLEDVLGLTHLVAWISISHVTGETYLRFVSLTSLLVTNVSMLILNHKASIS